MYYTYYIIFCINMYYVLSYPVTERLVFDGLFSSLAECCGSMRSVVCAVRRFVFNFYGWYVVVNICKYIVGCCGPSLWPVARRGPSWPVARRGPSWPVVARRPS